MSKFRFNITDHEGNVVAQTDWVEEARPLDAPQALFKVREQYGGDLRYRVEREGLANKPNKVTYTRYAIKVGDTVNYSRLLKADEKDAALVEIRQLYPGADITAQEVTQ
jgi:C-terminal processing protease CtpA/Prc